MPGVLFDGDLKAEINQLFDHFRRTRDPCFVIAAFLKDGNFHGKIVLVVRVG